MPDSSIHPNRVMVEADKLGLAQSPPYAQDGRRRAWQSGYEAAVRDLCAGKVGAFRVQP